VRGFVATTTKWHFLSLKPSTFPCESYRDRNALAWMLISIQTDAIQTTPTRHDLECCQQLMITHCRKCLRLGDRSAKTWWNHPRASASIIQGWSVPENANSTRMRNARFQNNRDSRREKSDLAVICSLVCKQSTLKQDLVSDNFAQRQPVNNTKKTRNRMEWRQVTIPNLTWIWFHVEDTIESVGILTNSPSLFRETRHWSLLDVSQPVCHSQQ
jgi:hypothetical protein